MNWDKPVEWIDLSSEAADGEPLVAWQEDDLMVYGPAGHYRDQYEAVMTGRMEPPLGMLSHPYPAWVEDDGLVVDDGAGPIPRWW